MRLITLLIAFGMLAACASPSPRGAADDPKRARVEEARAERERDRLCREVYEQRVHDPRCPGSQPRSRHPRLPLELPASLPERLL